MHNNFRTGQAGRLHALALICLCVLGGILPANGASGGASEFMVDLWTQDDGVPGNSVIGFAQGADGYLWMVGDQGLARFDGQRFVEAESEALAPRSSEWEGPRRYVRRLLGRAAGGVWLATGQGDLWRWTGHEFESWFAPNTTSHGYLELFEAGIDEVLVVTRSGRFLRGGKSGVRQLCNVEAGQKILAETLCRDEAGRVWFATDAGRVGRVGSNGGLDWVEPAGSARALTVDSCGNVWLGADAGLRLWDGAHFQEPPLVPGGEVFPVRAIVPAADGSLWVASGQRAWRLAEGHWSGPLGDWPDSTSPRAQLADRAGRLWLAAPTQGLRCLCPDGASRQLGPEQGITADVTALFPDQEGNLWASVYRTGIARIRERRFTPVRVTDGLHTTPLWNIAEDASGSIWFSAEFKGPVAWDAESDVEPARLPAGISAGGWTKALTVDRTGRIAAAVTDMGIVCLDAGAFKPVAPWPSGAGFPRLIFQDSARRWWLGSDLGLQSWLAGDWRRWAAAEGLPSGPVRALTEDAAGRLWVGTYGGGVALWDGHRFSALTQAHGLPSDLVYTLCAGMDGSLWIGTQGGLARWKDGRLAAVGVEHGLPDNRVVQLLEDGRGCLWVGTRDGLCRITLESFEAVARRERKAMDCLTFDRDDGLPSRVFQDRASPGCWRARDGELWFLTASGAVHFHPDRIRRHGPPPPVRIENLLVDGQAWADPGRSVGAGSPEALPWASVALRSPTRLELGPGAHSLEVQYASPSLAVPERVAYEYILEGLDRRWVPANGRRTATYALLPPGRYQFRVRARNHDGVWNEARAALAVVVHPFLWQRPWFGPFAGASLAFTGGISLTWLQRARLRRHMARLKWQRAQEAERRRISRDLHDHLGASLTEIGMLADDGASSGDAPAAAHDRYRVIRNRITAAVSDLDALVWAVDPRQDTLASLAAYLASFVEEYAAVSGLDCRIDVERALPHRMVSSEVRHHLFLAVKEAVHNAVRHARARQLRFELHVRDRRLEITVADDGQGFDPSAARAGNGLANLHERLAAASGHCEFLSAPGRGATVRLLWPLPS